MPADASPANTELLRRLARAEAALQAAREEIRRRAAVERIAGVGSWAWEVETRRVWWSEQMYRLCGLEPGSPITYERYRALLHPDLRGGLDGAVVEALKAEGPVSFQHRVLLPDGEERVLAGRVEPERGPDGRVVRMVGTAQDVTQRKEMERALRHSELRLRLFLAQTPAILWSTDLELRFTFGRGGGLERLGLEDDEALGVSLYEYFGTSDPDFLPIRAHRHALRGETRTFEMDWHGRRFEAWVEPFRSENGDLIGTIGFALDITERQAATAALRTSERHFRSLIENVQDVIAVVDRSGRILYESPSVRHVLGHAPGERVGSSVLEMVHPDDLPGVAGALEQAAAAPGTRQTATLRARHRDGSWRDLEVVGTDLTDDPAIGGIVLNVRDVTERNHLEATLHQAQRIESVGRLAGGIAHDFNNLLTVVRGTAQLLLADMKPGDPLRPDVEEIDRAAGRAAELTQQLLVFSRRQVLQPQVLDLNGLVGETERMLRRLVRADVALETRLDPALPAVRADASQMHQVLVNLVVNASDALPDGGRIAVSTRATVFPRGPGPAGPAALLSVEDDGVGMSEEVRVRAFEPFFTTKDPGRGTGLGLSTVYGIVEQSGGTVCIHSAPGAGTRVEVYLPDAGEAPSRGVAAQVPSRQAGAATILLVEDEDAVRAVARKALERAGFEVVAVPHAAEALRLVEDRGGGVDLVVTDVVMPGMSGPELAQRLRVKHPHLPVLFISGYTEEAVVRRGVAEGTAELLMKPFAPADLVARVHALLAD